jgi:CHAT domain-containing protein
MARERGQALVYEAEAVSEFDSIRACDLLWQARQIFDAEHNQTWCAIVDLRLSSLVPEGKEAVALADQATRILSGLGLRRRAAEGRLARAQALECLGDVQQARDLYRRVSADASTLGLAELRVRTLHAQARLDRSLPLYRKVAHQLETLRPALGTESLKAGFASRTRELYEEMLELLIAEGASVDEVFATVEAARARTLGDDMTMRKVRRNASASPEQSNTERLRQYVRSLQTRLRDAELATRSEEVECLQIETASAERELVRRLQEEAIFKAARGEPRGSGVIRLRDVQSRLEPDQILVEYFSISDRLLALCVSRDRADIYPNLTTTGDVATLAAKLRFQFNACARGGEGWVSRQGERLLTSAQTYLQRLYERLLAPLDLSSAQRVMIVPHGPLHGIPFHALHDGTAYLVEQREIAVTPSATVSFGRSKGGPASGAPLVVGAEDQYAPLVANEAREVARRLHVRPYMGTRATRSAFMRRAPTASIIHLAAHASLRHDNPQFSAIHFADGPLAVHDLADLRLRARLAVLSACATGVGAWREDDEVVSLARAFLAAGVERLLVSLWPVWDRTTTTMMTVFYEDLASAGSVGAALRRAQLHVRELSPHPYYWASFTEVR